MPTFKTVIHPRYKRADGIFRVKIRIIHNSQIRYIPTQYYASASEVNEKFDFKRGTSYVRDTQSTIDEYRKICNKNADGKSSVSCPLKPSDSAPLKHSTMPP